MLPVSVYSLVEMNDQIVTWLVFALVAALLVGGLLMIRRYWEERVHLTDEERELERRMSSLNLDQAHRRRDDEIVRLLRGDEQRTVADEAEQ
jgi:hypothetical protein